MDSTEGHDPPVPQGVDVDVPSVARMYDYYLGGNHNFAADRIAAGQALSLAPWTRHMAGSNRAFLGRVVTFLARECGVRQFLDLGSGVPTAGNVHEIAQGISSDDCRVMYVDIDPVAVAHSRLVLAGNPHATILAADIRDPASIQRHPDNLLHRRQPMAVLMCSILPFIQDKEDPAGLVDAYVQELAPGSFLVISHASLDGTNAAMRRTVTEAAKVYSRAGSPVTLRGRTEIIGWFAGLDLVEPGVVPLMDWRPDPGAPPEYREMVAFGGVGKVPSCLPPEHHLRWVRLAGEPEFGPATGGRLPCRTPTGGHPPVFIEPCEWNLLRFMDELPYDVLLFEAERTIELHRPVARKDTDNEPDPHARWRDLRDRAGATTTYLPQRCRACTDEGCPRLDAAVLFREVISPLVAAEKKRAQPP